MPPRSSGTRPFVVTDPTVLVRHANGRLVAMRDRQIVATIPLADVSHLALHGPVTVTGAAMARCMDLGIDVTLYSSGGFLRGFLQSGQSKDVYLLLAQVEAWRDEARRTAIARAIVAGKIESQRVLLQRRGIDRGAPACAEAAVRLSNLRETLARAATLDEIRGAEGAASAAYFGAFGAMLDPPWRFPGRSRRPPPDPVNAALGFGYALATGEVVRHVVRAGFDPRIGLLHGLRYGRESLALDLVEELRAPLVDRFVTTSLNRRILLPEHFEESLEGGVRLTADGRRAFLEAWELALAWSAPAVRGETPESTWQPTARIPEDDETAPARGPTWRFRIERQAYRLKGALMQRTEYRSMHESHRSRRVRRRVPRSPTDEAPEPDETLDKSGEG